MKIGFYDPYLDTLGGGERYILTAAELLSKENRVDLLLGTHLQNLDVKDYKKTVLGKFNLNLNLTDFIPAPIGKGSNFFQRAVFLRRYDLLISFTDGSIFYSTAKKNFLHIQSPIVNYGLNSFWNRFKLKSWDLIIYNSLFTKTACEKYWKINGKVIYPPVDVKKIKVLKKKKIILSVGRLFGYLREKKHELMIVVFKNLYNKKIIKDWSLHLVGSASEGDKRYIEHLKEISKGYPIHLFPNLPYGKLIEKYGEASIYWHAMGYGETEPTKMEHFGISTVEAMAGGCVPIAVGKGGQNEIIGQNKFGFLWNSTQELEKRTIEIVNNQKLFFRMSNKAHQRAERFSKERFRKELDDLISRFT